jgi:hypothetical protein
VLFHPRKSGGKNLRTKRHRQAVAAFLKDNARSLWPISSLSSLIIVTAIRKRVTPIGLRQYFPHPKLSPRFITPVHAYQRGQHD